MQRKLEELQLAAKVQWAIQPGAWPPVSLASNEHYTPFSARSRSRSCDNASQDAVLRQMQRLSYVWESLPGLYEYVSSMPLHVACAPSSEAVLW